MKDDKMAREIADISPTPELTPQAYIETQNIKKLSNVFGFTLLSQQFIALFAILSTCIVYYFIQIVLLRKHFSNISTAFIQDSNSLGPIILMCFVYFSYMFIPFILQAFILKQNPLQIVPVKKIKKVRYLIPALSVVLLLTFISQFITEYITLFLSFIHLKPISPDFTAPNNTPALIAFFVEICILAPLCEEFIFRGIILNNLKRFGSAFAIIVSSILFAMVHGDILQMPLAFIVGLIFGVLVLEFGSIWVTIIMHCAVNTISLTVGILSVKYGDNFAGSIYLGFISIVILVAVPVLVMLTRNHVLSTKYKEYKNSILPMPFMMKKFFTTPGMILFAVITVIIAILYTRII